MRNPKWHRDEIILPLDLYFSKDRGSIDAKNPKIIELSAILNSLPLSIDRPDSARFRNVNGVTLKLSNFLPFDKNYHGKGMKGSSKLDQELFGEYEYNQGQLKTLALNIKKLALNPELKRMVSAIEDDEMTLTDSVREGQLLYKLHKVRERARKIVEQKKKQAFHLYGRLFCEVCDFVFEDYYGDLGHGYIECHHAIPLSNSNLSRETKLEDLRLVCSNCHRMLHRQMNTLSVDGLRKRILDRKIPA